MKRGENLRKYDHSGPTYRTRPVEYRLWSGMIQRCTNPKFVDWRLYGGRGISVCERWRQSFATFFADMGARPSAGLSLDRWPDSNGNYEPGNVRWATAKQQCRHTTRNRQITANGRTQTLVEWSELTGIKRETIADRIAAGWTEERAVGTPTTRNRSRNARGLFEAV